MKSLARFLESKHTLLRAALENAPQYVVYRVRKYGKIPVESGDDVVHVAVRPDDLLEIQTIRDKEASRRIITVRFVCDHNSKIEDQRFRLKWATAKMERWLQVNAAEQPDEEYDMEALPDYL